MINDHKYTINGKEAVFTAELKTSKHSMSKPSPMAKFTYEDGSSICVVYNMLSKKYTIIGADSIDKNIQFIYGVWKIVEDGYEY